MANLQTSPILIHITNSHEQENTQMSDQTPIILPYQLDCHVTIMFPPQLVQFSKPTITAHTCEYSMKLNYTIVEDRK